MTVITFTSTLLEKKFLTKDVMFLSFSAPPHFTFQAGQFVSFVIENEGKTRPKSYSLLNPPSERGKMDFCVKIVEKGFASVIFQNAKKGDAFTIKGPFGKFLFDGYSKNKEHWFIGIGTGITPLYSIIKEHLALNPAKKFIFLFGEKTKSDLLFHDELYKLERKYLNFEYWPILSKQHWNGRMGRVQKYVGEKLENKTFYICGLQEFVQETKEYLLERGVSEKEIHFERYT